MRLASRLDVEADRLLAGDLVPGDDPATAELATAVAALRAHYAQPSAPEVRERHLALIAAELEATRAGSAVAADRKRSRVSTWITPARRRRGIAFRLAATGLAGLVATAGLAVAGVKPPPPLDSALERVGISVGDDESPSDAGGEAGPAGRDQARGGGGGPQAGGDGQGEVRTGDGARGPAGSGSGIPPAAAEPGLSTADEARREQAPPSSPGQSGSHAPEGTGPPANPGPPVNPGPGLGQGQGANRAPQQGAPGTNRAGQAPKHEAAPSTPGPPG